MHRPGTYAMNAALRLSDFSPDELAMRLYQQEQVARFGLFALAAASFDEILTEACVVASDGLQTELAKVLRYQPDSNDFLVIAGVGWRPGTVGQATLGGGLDSPAGFALHTGLATRANDLTQEARFRMPKLLADHGVHSAINVPVGGLADAHFGVLEVDSTTRHEFVEADTAFMQSVSNILGAAVTRREAERAKDRLLQDKDMLMQEVHHRVKNSLQLVRTLLQLQSRGASPEARAQLDEAARRIMTIGSVHQRLYEGGSVAATEAGAYLRALFGDMQAMLDGFSGNRALVLRSDPIMLPADDVTPLGLIVSELVTNALKYGGGDVVVSLDRVPEGLRVAVEDAGPGFPADGQPPKGLGMRLVTALAKGDPARAVAVDRSVPHGRVVVTLTLGG